VIAVDYANGSDAWESIKRIASAALASTGTAAILYRTGPKHS